MTAAPLGFPCPECGAPMRQARPRCLDCAAIAAMPTDAGAPPLTLHRPTVAPDDDSLSAQEIADAHFRDAVERVHYGYQGALHWHLPSLQATLGPIARGDLVILGARTGSGKTLVLNNAFDAWVTDPETRHVGLYIGTEQAPPILKVKLACARAGVSVRLVLTPERWEVGTPEHIAAQDAAQAELKVINRGEYAARAIFPDIRRVTTAELRKWVRIAVRKYGVTFVIIDHIDRMDAGPGRNGAHEMNEIVVASKEMAVDEDIQMILASQVKRSLDPLASVIPPDVDDFAGTSGKEREADVAAVVSRVLDPDADPEKVKKVRARLLDAREIQLRNTALVKCRKHRVDDARLGASCLLDVRGHRLLERDSRHTYRTASYIPRPPEPTP